MNSFTRAIVRKPGISVVDGLTTSNLGKPEFSNLSDHHDAYVDVLINDCGLDVKIIPENELFPDWCFVEDTAIITDRCAIISKPGAETRRGEVIGLDDILLEFFEEEDILSIQEPGNTVDGGDIMQVGEEFYIGVSERTNFQGALEMSSILKFYGFSVHIVEMDVDLSLHLKSGLSYLGDGVLNICRSYLDFFNETNQINVFEDGFDEFNVIENEVEYYSGNCVRINEYLLFPKGFDGVAESIQELDNFSGKILELDCSEFMKIDGGLSCLSLRF